MKLANPKQTVKYGLKNDASYWRILKGVGKETRFAKCPSFIECKNERQATAAAKRIRGGRVVRQITTVTESFDE